MLHVILHVAVPIAVAAIFYRHVAVAAASVMVATMVVDLDHLPADPIYDPERCSIGFHPLHTMPAILVYVAAFSATVLLAGRLRQRLGESAARTLQWVSVGLMIHIVLDWSDCLL